MSFTSLLFCPDEKTARVVTQVLSELDFTVELAHESFAAVQRLTEEHFHAVVVDCQNEQDAALLFKAARNSAQNSGSLSVAVVEGQAGVAKAFRIGANLVLTKPVNVEQSKSTLRVARGLLKKTQAKPLTAPSAIKESLPAVAAARAESAAHLPSFDLPAPARTAFASAPSSAAASKPSMPLPTPAPTPAASVPYSGLVLESEPEPATEAADAAVLESLPEITGKRAPEPVAPVLRGHAEPIAASTAGQAAAAAMAPEPKTPELRPAGAAPMFTNEPIVSTSAAPVELPEVYEPEPIAVPSFAGLESTSNQSGGGTRLIRTILLLGLLAVGAYYAWQQPLVRDYAQKLLHRNQTEAPAAPAEEGGPTQPVAPHASAENTPVAPTVQPWNEAPAPATDAQDTTVTTTAHQPQPKSRSEETIEVQEMPISRDGGKVTVTPKPQPIVVKAGAPAKQVPSMVPPSVDAVSGATSTELPNLAPTNFQLPNPAPGAIRISQGVSQGLLVKRVQPVYPPFAKQSHKEGTVQLLATIDKNGGIKKVQVLGGDPMLSKAASDAVKQWQYRPYLLNGQPVEIETQITIVFKAQ